MSQKALVLIGVAVVLLFIAVWAIPTLVDVNRYRPQIEARLEDQLGRDVSLGAMHLSLLPLGFRVQQIVIAEGPEFQTGRPFAQAQMLYVQPKLLPLFRGDLQIHGLELSRPTVELVRSKQGTWNFASLTVRRKQDGQPVSIERLKIQDGQIGVTDLQQNEPRTVYDHIDLDLRDFAPDKAFSMTGRAHITDGGKQTIAFDGKAGPLQRDAVGRTPFDGKIELNEVSLAGLERVLNLQVLENSDAVLTGTATLKNDQGMFASNGKLEARTPRIRGVDIGYPIRVDYDFQGNLNENTLQIQTADLHLGKTPIRLKGRIDGSATPAKIDVNVSTSQASLGEAARLAAAFGLAFSADTKVDGLLNLNVHAQGPFNKPLMDGEAAARNVEISGGNLRQPVHVDAMQFSLSPHVIQSNEFTATTGRTNVRAQFTLSEYASNTPQVKASLSTGNAEIGELLNIAHAYGVSTVEGVKGSGTAQLNVIVAGPIKQTDNLTYSGSGALRNATFEASSLAKPLTVRNADLRFNANSVTLDNLDFSLGQTVARGNLTLNNPAVPRVEFSLAADKIDVTEWQALTQAKAGQVQTASGAGQSHTERSSLLRRVGGSGRVTVDTVIYDQLVLNDVHSTVRLDKGIITINPITAGLYNGREIGTVVLDMRTEPATYSVNTKLQDVDANRLLSSVSPIKDGLYGVLSANVDSRFTATGDARSIARSLDGRISLNLQDGAIANMDLLHEVASMAQFLRTGKTVKPVTNVAQLSGDFDVADGVARTKNLKASMDAGSFAATGTVDLGQQRLNLHVTAVLSKEYSEAVGGTAIGGFMTTALANEKGEIVVPMIITGTFQDPQFAPDFQKVAEMKLERILPTADNPAQLSIGILGRILGREKPETPKEQTSPEEEQRNNKKGTEDTVSDILNRILGNTQKRPGEQPR